MIFTIGRPIGRPKAPGSNGPGAGHDDPPSTPDPVDPTLELFERIFEENFEYVWSSLRRLGVVRDDAEDIAQDTFVTAYRRLATYDTARPVRPWLFGIAYRVASDYRRLVRHKREVLDNAVTDYPSQGSLPDDEMVRRQDQQLVIDALAGIDVLRRPVFILSEIDNVPMREIAQGLEIPLHTAYSRLKKARVEFAVAVGELSKQREEG